MKRQPQKPKDGIADLVFIDIHVPTLPRAATEILRPTSDAYVVCMHRSICSAALARDRRDDSIDNYQNATKDKQHALDQIQ
jgi:hypothetical protein